MLAFVISICSGVLVAAITWEAHAIHDSVKGQHAQQKAHDRAIDRRIDALYKCQLAFGHDRIYAECLRHLHNGYITTADLDNMMYLMTGYESVGGNSTAHILWQKVKHLPIDDTKEPKQIQDTYPGEIKDQIKAFKEA